MRPLLALLLVLSSCHAVRTNRTKALPAKADFLRALSLARQAGRGGRFVVLDVGANNGKWSRGVMRSAVQALGGDTSGLELVMFDPQPRFASILRKTSTLTSRPTTTVMCPVSLSSRNNTPLRLLRPDSTQ